MLILDYLTGLSKVGSPSTTPGVSGYGLLANDSNVGYMDLDTSSGRFNPSQAELILCLNQM